uniref:Structural maintenance of chromosomes protein 5 n=1 Tax=Diabrotica virgifera virgifera TaxID=50390 RepID=A0A6P7F6B6_DIAVI
MYQPGSIRKIEVTNFVTYSHVEFYPGPNLNMIIGPNGTGKSTMVAAIILGLGGNPKVVGRGTKVSEYVKHNCEHAVINTYLQDKEDNKFIKVTREFDLHDRTTWKINNRKVKLNDVLECIKPFNIQVDNLCQFLPQDRVQDFAKLNKQELLRETQKALCRFDLIEKQDLLVQNREHHKQLHNSIAKSQQKLQESVDLNVRLEGRVQSFNKKKEYTEKIQHIERKIAWRTYEEKRGELDEIKKDKNKAQEVYDKYKTSMKPIEKEITSKKKEISDIQQENSKTTKALRNVEASIDTNLEKIDGINGSVRKLNDELLSKLAEIEQWNEEIKNASNKLEDMKKLQKEASAKSSESEQLKQQYTNELTKITKTYQTLQTNTDELLQIKQESVRRIRYLENETQKLENVKQNRLEHLRRINSDAYAAVDWLRNNKHLFRGEIYEPIMLELNVTENRHAKYIENVIPLRDRIAFTCVNKDDMNKLLKSLRQEKQLSVNVVHSDKQQNSSQFQPSMPIEHLRQYGFYTYMSNLFTAPEPIMNYLCKTYRLHNIPLGDKTTDNVYEKVPKEIRSFFSEEYRYSVSISKYSGQKSIRQVAVRSDGSLSLTLDVVKMNQIRGEIEEAKRKVSTYDAQTEGVNKKLSVLNDQMVEKRAKLKELHQHKQHAETIAARVNTLQKKLVEMEQLKKSPDEIRNGYKKKGEQFLKSIPNIHSLIQKSVGEMVELEKRSMLNIRKVEEVSKAIKFLENDVSEKRRQCQEAEDTLKRIKERYSEFMEEAKALLSKAKSLSKGFTPGDDGFDEFREEYEALAADIEGLNVQRDQFHNRIACLNVADDGEMEEYENRLKEIDNLQKEIERSNTDLNKMTTRMERCEQEWLVPLKQLLSDINLKFASAFQRMGCAGEISVYTGDNDDQDYAQYGISIKVTYRNGEPLQELNSNIQSGGERAVATAAFMLSLQELTPVPFRCVDEINQGMDASNERRIFELVVDTTCNNSSSQYFLITPKLVPHLRYVPNMLVHIVHNGPFVNQDKKWGFSKLCNPIKIQIA